MKATELKKGNSYLLTDKYFTRKQDSIQVTFIECLSDGTRRFSFIKDGHEYTFGCGSDYVEKYIVEIAIVKSLQADFNNAGISNEDIQILPEDNNTFRINVFNGYQWDNVKSVLHEACYRENIIEGIYYMPQGEIVYIR